MKKVFLVLTMLVAQFYFSQEVVDVKVENPQEKQLPPELNKEKINSYNKTFFKFMSALRFSDRKIIDLLLSDKVKTLVTDDILKKVSEGIDTNKKLAVLKTGYQSLMDGKSYPMIQYKYEGDSPVEEAVTVLFEEDGKILGIKPADKEK
ncbi:hypothetical protein [Chryseobacterium populi]|uniref:Uncharacterized protein n=1 Tax=Chryseobacterium populi TaxID=1144316 RepID=J2SUP2_9FLAO|nr:hypothetical protein [Chryseobacterium populi]EJL69332.1 hypothetical protein PMI13_03299 [Chryseobacterium populi]